MTPPRYQDLRAADIPTVERDGVTAKVIAGEALGVVGPANTHVPILYVHARRRPARRSSSTFLPIPTPSRTCSRAPESSDPTHATARRAQLVAFGPSGDTVRIRGGAETLDVIVLAGRPLRSRSCATGRS